MKNFELTKIPFEIVCDGGNKKNYDLYTQYIKSAILKHSYTLATTYKSYYDRMKLFFQYLYKFEDNLYIASPECINDFDNIWERYCYQCLEAGNSKVTMLNKRTACSTFFDWCVKKRIIPVNPFTYIDKMRITEIDKVKKGYFLTQREIFKIQYFLDEGLYEYADKTGKKKKLRFSIQDNLIFNLFLDSGGRISEIQQLTFQQLDLEKMIFEDVRLKEGYIEPLIFFKDTQRIIKELIEDRRKKGIESDYLLISNYKNTINQISKSAIRASVRKIGKIVGIDNFYPHSIRKTIVNLAGQIDEQLASDFAHHTNTAVTKRHYIKKKNADVIRNQMQSIRNKIGL